MWIDGVGRFAIDDDEQLREMNFPKQLLERRNESQWEAWFSADLGAELGALEYPLYFMDFESVNPKIPRFTGMRPYDQLPFQSAFAIGRFTMHPLIRSAT